MIPEKQFPIREKQGLSAEGGSPFDTAPRGGLSYRGKGFLVVPA
jgi:hypothetical protein